MVRLIEKESRMVNVRNWERRRGNCWWMGTELKFCQMKKVLEFGCTKFEGIWHGWTGNLKMAIMVNFMLWVFYCACTHTHTHKPSQDIPLRVTTEESGLITTRHMLSTRPAPSPPQQPRHTDCLLCSGLPASVLGDVSAPAPHGLTSASLTDPVLQALLQGSSKSRVALSCRRLGSEFTSSQRDLCNPRVQEVSLAPDWGWRDPFSRWKSLCCVWVCV